MKEALLALRIEQAYSKDKIFELYLNEIYLGLGSYGIAAAALNYFDKPVNQLTVAEAAYLAALPKAPENYNPFRHEDRGDRAPQLGHRPDGRERLHPRRPTARRPRRARSRSPSAPRGNYLFASEFFAEEVRRNLIDLYGATSSMRAASRSAPRSTRSCRCSRAPHFTTA